MPDEPIVPSQEPRPIPPSSGGEAFIPLDNSARAIEILRAAAAGARQENSHLADVVDAVTAAVTIRHRQTGELRAVPARAVPFFTSQGFEPVQEPASAPEPQDPADSGASTTTTPDPTSKEN